MGKLQKTQDGFGAVEGLLIVIVILIVGFTSYYVYNANKKVSNTYNTATKASSSSTPALKPVALTQTYTDPAGKFTFKYPADWVAKSLPKPNIWQAAFSPSAEKSQLGIYGVLNVNSGPYTGTIEDSITNLNKNTPSPETNQNDGEINGYKVHYGVRKIAQNGWEVNEYDIYHDGASVDLSFVASVSNSDGTEKTSFSKYLRDDAAIVDSIHFTN